MILGIDEVGRGPWAGPLVVGAVVLGSDVIEGLTDSKKLTKGRRESLAKQIVNSDASYGLGWVHAAELDSIGLSAALVTATKRAVEQITVSYHEIIIDGTVNFLKDTPKGKYVTTMKKADLLITAVSAAAVLAKVARDDYMSDLAQFFPNYGFESHVGYGTARHAAALERYGLTEEHRRSFAPVAKAAAAALPTAAPVLADDTNTQRASSAETVAAEWLTSRGYTVLERNWTTRFFEIDIIAKKADALFFIEVEHRKTPAKGSETSAMTTTKLRQMHFAASLYLVRHQTIDIKLAVLTTHGVDQIEVGQLLLLK